MQLTILQEKLKEGLGIIERTSLKSLTLPILNNILVASEKNFIRLASTDLEIGIQWWSLVKTENEGQIAVPARVLSGLVGLLPNKKITLEAKDDVLLVKNEGLQTKIKGIRADEFPIIPTIERHQFVSIGAAAFCSALNQVADIASPSSARPEISGVFLSFQKNQVTIAATDSFRLAEKKIFLEKTLGDQKYSLILPQKTAREVVNIFKESQGLNIYFSPNHIMLESLMEETQHPAVQITSRLIEGEYPNYQEIIPQKHSTKIILNKSVFLNQIKAAAVFSGKRNEAKLNISPKKGRVEVSSESAEVGEYTDSFPAKVEGEEMTVSFNARFLMDGLSSMLFDKNQEQAVIFNLNSEEGPGVLKSASDPDYIYIVMPIKAS